MKVAVAILLAGSAWGQSSVLRLPGPPPLALPAWLAPFPQARDVSTKNTPTEASSTYMVQGLPATVISHYEEQLRAAGVEFQTKPDGMGTSIEGSTDKYSGTVRVREENGGAKVEVSYGPRHDPPPVQAADRVLPPLRLEWPAWLEVPGGKLISQRTNPPGRVPTWSVESCPGDVIGKPSQGCLARVYESTRPLRNLYEYFGGLLEHYGFTTRSPSTEPYASLPLGKSIGEPFAQLKMREYPVPADDTYYRHIDIFMRQPQTPTTRVEITFLVKNGRVGTVPDVSGSWAFVHVGDRFQGTIVLRQSGTEVTGIWHTQIGKIEPDDQLSGRIDGHTMYLLRPIANTNLEQRYVLTISPDGNRIDGYGDGWGIQHGSLNMRRLVSAPPLRASASAPPAWYEVTPRGRDEWKWLIQSVATRGGSEVK